MPELPEVETVRRGVEPHVLGRRIIEVVVREPRMRWPVPADFAAYACGQRIEAVTRRGKYLVFALDGGDRIIVHLGMTGRVLVLEAGHALKKHDHVDFLLDDGRLLRYHDPRRFGAVLPWPKADAGHVLIDSLGPEPFSAGFSGDYLYQRSRGKKVAVKSFLMDGQVVVGAGNIYAAESLFRARIRPTRAAGKVGRAEYGRLADEVRVVLTEAITQGGTTLRDFAGADGASGYFQQDLYVYGREGLACRICGTVIKGVRLGSRASCWCPGCQR